MDERVMQARFTADTSDLENGLGRIQDTTEKTGGSFEELIAKVGASHEFFEAAKKTADDIVDTLKDLYGASAQAENQYALLNNAVQNAGRSTGLTTDQLTAQANALEDHSTASHIAVENVQQLLLRMTDLSGSTVTDATQAILDASASGRDLSETAQGLARALEDPFNAARGLRAAGVTLTEQQKEQLNIFKKNNDVADAQKFVIKQVEDRYKGLAQTMHDTGTGPAQDLKNKMDDLKESMGKSLTDAITPLIVTLIPVIEGFTKWAEQHQKLVGAILAGLAVFAGLIAVLGTIVAVMGFLALVAAAGVTGSFIAMGVVIAAVIAVLTTAGIFIATHWTAVRDLVVGTLINMRDNAAMYVNAIVNFFKGLAGGIGAVISNVPGIIIAPFRAAFNEIAMLWNNTVGKINFKAPDWVPAVGGKSWGFPTVPYLAQGGPINKDGAVVGEQGMEYFVPWTSGKIVPNNQMNQSINITVNTGDIHGIGDVRSIGDTLAGQLRLARRGV